MFTNKFVIKWDNEFVAIDFNSGGYPYKVNHPEYIRFFNTRIEAENFWGIFTRADSQNKYSNFQILEIEFRIKE